MNVNTPAGAKGVRRTRLSARDCDGKVVPAEDPMGREIFWLTVAPTGGRRRARAASALGQGYASIAPPRLDLTGERALAAAEVRHPLGSQECPDVLWRA